MSVALLRRGGGGRCVGPLGIVALGGILLLYLFGFEFLLPAQFLLLFLFQFIDDAVDYLQLFFLRHHREFQQRVLQMDGIGVRHQFVEHLRAVRQFLVVVAILVQQSDGLAVAALGIVVFLHLPVQVSQGQQQHAFLYATARRLLVAFLVGGNGLHRVLLGHIDITHGVIHLIQIVLVVVVARHTFQPTDHPLGILCSDHLRLGDAGIKLQYVGWMTAHHLLEGSLCLGTVAELPLYLSHQEPLAGSLLAALLVLDDFPQIGHGLLQFTIPQIVVSVGVIPVLHGTEVHRVTVHVAYHVLCIVEPVEFHIAFGEPGTGQSVLHGLRLVESAHIGERCGRLVEGTFLELRLAQQHPGLPDKRVILPAFQPLTVFGGLGLAALPFWLGLDTVHLDGFLRLLNGLFELALAYLTAVLVADGVEGEGLGIVVLVAFLLFEVTVDEGLLPVVVDVVFGIKCVPPSRLGRVVLGGTGCQEDRWGDKGRQKEKEADRGQLFNCRFLVFSLICLFHQTVQFACLVVSGGAGGTVVSLFDGVVPLVEPVGYCGNDAQHHDHPYAYQRKTHPKPCSFISSTVNPALARLVQKLGYDFVTTCGLLMMILPDFKAYGVKASAIR